MRIELPLAMLEKLPNPILIKDRELRYVWVNPAFEEFFGKTSAELIGNVDKDIFVDRQATQCNGGDLRVLETGEVDNADETIIGYDGAERDIITRKSRIVLDDGDTYLVGVLHDVTEVSSLNRALAASRETMAELSRTDPLTGIFNRRGLTEATNGVAAQGASVIVFDIDHFKQINDRFGHSAGDDALRQITAVAAANLRKDDHLARVGGEEFALYLTEITPDAALRRAESIRSAFEASPLVVGNEAITLTASFGVASSSSTAIDLEDLLRQADRAMYTAKEAGRNRVLAASEAALSVA